MSDKLDLILNELQKLNSRQDDSAEMLEAVKHAQELANAKLEGLSKEISGLKEVVTELNKILDYQLNQIAKHDQDIHLLKFNKQ